MKKLLFMTSALILLLLTPSAYAEVGEKEGREKYKVDVIKEDPKDEKHPAKVKINNATYVKVIKEHNIIWKFGGKWLDGNTRTTNFFIELEKLKKELYEGRVNLKLTGKWLYEEKAGEITAFSYDIKPRIELVLAKGVKIAASNNKYASYLYLGGRYEDDRFSGYTRKVLVLTGVGGEVKGDKLTLGLELGPGHRHSEEKKDGKVLNKIIATATAKLGWKITDDVGFTQSLAVEAGSDNTYTELGSKFKVRINGNFKVELAYTRKHNTEVPEGIDNTDHITTTAVVWGF